MILREARLTNDLINRVEALLWHLSGRVHRISALTEGQQGDRAELQLRLRESKRWYRERLRLGAVQGVQRPESGDSGERARAVGENPDAIPISKWGFTFSGKETEPVAVLKFLKRVEEGRSVNGIDEERMRRGFAQLLEPPALTWYRECVRDSVSSWRELKERLKQEFLPDDYEEGVLENLRECKQGSSERVSFFVARFEEISGWLSEPLTEERKLKMLRKNILPSYREKLWNTEITSRDHLIRLCKKIEASTVPVTNRERMATVTRRSGGAEQTCFRCRQTGHIARECLDGAAATDRRIRCYICERVGHTSRNCPRRVENASAAGEGAGDRSRAYEQP
ncbi:hypothetical protein Zmor_023901 [Zophobas morio]|uniref:CCHC-type domain-containing protein n=1 Tax=Zophobas morio TaxID=2755281 RepID=A0AA38M8C6_9CUCU|nr:hypothetical protein Zmor_023846 [Zophobas morio]KAJ3646309.1 hypothetical protein Zmor_023901 [Zophobas morio]